MFLQHGILASSESWILNGPDSLGLRLANEGYDVWMGNNRGNMYSKKHLTLDLNDPNDQQKYFDFSFYELAEHDLPAQIDYVRETSGQDKVTYIGHSQGTTQMFTALAEGFGNINDKLNLYVALAPITRLFGSKSPFLQSLSSKIPLVRELLNFLNI